MQRQSRKLQVKFHSQEHLLELIAKLPAHVQVRDLSAAGAAGDLTQLPLYGGESQLVQMTQQHVPLEIPQLSKFA